MEYVLVPAWNSWNKQQLNVEDQKTKKLKICPKTYHYFTALIILFDLQDIFSYSLLY